MDNNIPPVDIVASPSSRKSSHSSLCFQLKRIYELFALFKKDPLHCHLPAQPVLNILLSL